MNDSCGLLWVFVLLKQVRLCCDRWGCCYPVIQHMVSGDVPISPTPPAILTEFIMDAPLKCCDGWSGSAARGAAERGITARPLCDLVCRQLAFFIALGLKVEFERNHVPLVGT